MADEKAKRKDSDSPSKAESGVSDLDDEPKIPYPKSVFFILSTEACERFSYYGMRAILSLYLRHLYLPPNGTMSSSKAESVSTVIYHTFVFFSYVTALFGAFLADSFLGKFKTIFYISLIYVLGQSVLTLGAVPDSAQGISGMPQEVVSYIGLLLIGFGTGGIKPCVVSFGADQFTLPQQEPQMQTFFGVFYASINFGSMISTILTPMFRRQSCFDEDECYTLAFGVPAGLMVVAIIFFVSGRPGYKIAIPERNIVKEFFQAMGEAIRQKRKATIKREHWMDYAEDRFGTQFVADIKAVLRISLLFCLYPLFWALYDQQGSRWTFQATRMDGKTGAINILPDQMQVVNAALILIFIPIFDKIIYPLSAKMGLLKTPLQRIVTGGTLLAIAFIISAIVELILEKTYPDPPGLNQARLAFHNGLPTASNCQLDVLMTNMTGDLSKLDKIQPGNSGVFKNPKGHDLLDFHIPETRDEKNKKVPGFVRMFATLSFSKADPAGIACAAPPVDTYDFDLNGEFGTTVVVYLDPDDNELVMTHNLHTDEVDKSQSGNPWLRVMYYLPEIVENSTVMVFANENYKDDPEKRKGRAANWDLIAHAHETEGEASGKLGMLRLCIHKYPGENETICARERDTNEEYFDYKYGGSFNHYLIRVKNETTGHWDLIMDREQITEPNTIHVLWLLPQYIVLTAGEVLFSITSISFSFTQAPKSMKAVVQALYLFTTALGNLIDIIVIGSLSSLFTSQAQEFFLFAGLMLLDMAILAWLATRYTYVDYSGREEHAAEKQRIADEKAAAKDHKHD